MRILIDTCLFLGIVEERTSMHSGTRAKLMKADNDAHLSVVPAWEIVLSPQLGNLP